MEVTLIYMTAVDPEGLKNIAGKLKETKTGVRYVVLNEPQPTL